MHKDKGGYSWLIRPFQMVIDTAIIIILCHLMLSNLAVQDYFLIILPITWILVSFSIDFYEVFRFTPLSKILSLLSKQFGIFFLVFFTVIGIFNFKVDSRLDIVYFFLMAFIAIGCSKAGIYYLLKQYRSKFGGNSRVVVILGHGDSIDRFVNFFESEKQYGYKLIGSFGHNTNMTFDYEVNRAYNYLRKHIVDEIYCVIDQLSRQQINRINEYCDETGCVLKFLDNTLDSYDSILKKDYYNNYLPVYSLPEVALDKPINNFIKRVFDIIIALIVLFGVLSWLTPLLFVIIKLESSGPLIYRHMREGVNFKEFECYKFRSLRYHSHQDLKEVVKGDQRVTNVGRFIRRTSIDELPQFINVLLGEMSVVGPRPHIDSYNEEYLKTINKYSYVLRHAVKPGITGLAQINGYRGEVQSDKDIINRVKYDIFYIENWSLVLDIKIIFETIVRVITGDEKAY